jgi:pyruvate, water dikinase
MKKTISASLEKLLLDGNRPTKAGKALLAKLEKIPGLEGKTPWILRSSFTGEDRPNKSAAGLYDSVPNAISAKQRILGIVQVIASSFNPDAVKNNLEYGIDGSQVWPAVIVQRCLDAETSGVAVSRGNGGAFGDVAYQARRGFGGGVDREDSEEGIIGSRGNTIGAKLGDRALLGAERSAQLREAVLAIERRFHETIEPGAGHAVDVEWVRSKGTLWVVQSRVFPSA